MTDQDFPEQERTVQASANTQRAGETGKIESKSDLERVTQQENNPLRYRRFFESSPEGMFFLDNNGTIIEANQAFCDLFGFLPSEVRGMNVHELHAGPEHGERFEQEMYAKGFVKNLYWKALTRDKQEKDCRISGSADFADDQTPRGYHCVVHDVTESTKALEALFHNDRIKALGEMAAAAAHNFRNLLQIMVGGSRLALSNLETGNLSEVRISLEQILADLRSAAETARLLGHFSGVRREKTVPAGRIFDLSRTVEKAIEICVPWIEADPDRSGVNISLDPHLAPGCLVKGVETELLEVVVNLIGNAAEALRDEGAIIISTSTEQGQVCLKIRDNGIGIPKEHLSKVFQPFWTTKGVEGTGLGLASSYGIVCRHGGDISIDSEVGQGTVVTVRLPVPDQGAAPAVTYDTRQKPSNYRILVVDDLQPLLSILKHGLTKRGQKVLTASSGEEALKLFRDHEFDAVVCDLAMPHVSGWQVGSGIIEICRSKGIPKPPFILLTGWGGQVDQQERIAESGVDAVVEKPMDIPRLLDVIRDLVRERQQQEP